MASKGCDDPPQSQDWGLPLEGASETIPSSFMLAPSNLCTPVISSIFSDHRPKINNNQKDSKASILIKSYDVAVLCCAPFRVELQVL